MNITSWVIDYARKTRMRPARNIRVHEGRRAERAHRIKLFFLGLLVFLVSVSIAVWMLVLRSTWDRVSAYAFAVVYEPRNAEDVERSVVLIGIQPQRSEATALPLPDTLPVETIRGYGQYKASALYRLMQLEKLPHTFLTQSLSYQFGLFIRTVLRTSLHRPQEITPDHIREVLWRQVRFLDSSTLSVVDRYALWNALRSMRDDQIAIVDLPSSSFFRNGGLELSTYDTFALSVFADPTIRAEATSVVIVNTTPIPRLGTRVARALSAMGVQVVQVTDSEDVLRQTQLVLFNRAVEDTAAFKLLKTFLSLTAEQVRQDEATASKYRGEAILFIGEDLKDLLTARP